MHFSPHVSDNVLRLTEYGQVHDWLSEVTRASDRFGDSGRACRLDFATSPSLMFPAPAAWTGNIGRIRGRRPGSDVRSCVIRPRGFVSGFRGRRDREWHRRLRHAVVFAMGGRWNLGRRDCFGRTNCPLRTSTGRFVRVRSWCCSGVFRRRIRLEGRWRAVDDSLRIVSSGWSLHRLPRRRFRILNWSFRPAREDATRVSDHPRLVSIAPRGRYTFWDGVEGIGGSNAAGLTTTTDLAPES